ncbi:MAG: sodium:alanine symporter family protein [Ruminococcaceae bacterium]|nr:sodium:alanine symporter family protein [Oscillospiraceae bacterium]
MYFAISKRNLKRICNTLLVHFIFSHTEYRRICELEKVIRLIDTVNNVVWGMSGILMLLGCGMYFTFRLKFFQITKLSLWTKQTFGSLFKREKAEAGQITPYKAVASALASSVGTGNIVGVATAIAAGGPGAVFWMWISAFFGMATKYGEILLAVKFREKKKDEVFGGPMYYIEKGLGKNYRWLAVLFSISGIFACFGMGGMSQANAISSIIAPMGILSKKSIGIILGIMAFAVISGGISRISSAAAFLVPIMAGAYLLCGIAVLFIYPENVVMAMGKIFMCALSPAAIYGATSGLMVKNALRFGFARGVFSNEAGLGSAPMIHASAKAKSPALQGFWGVFEVFVDTMLVCSVTAIVVISSDVCEVEINGSNLTSLAFGKLLGDFGLIFVNVAICLFALSTILGWSYYGERCILYLTAENGMARNIFRVAFAFAVALGSYMGTENVWALGDMFNGMMMIPNLIGLILLSEIVVKESDKTMKNKT